MDTCLKLNFYILKCALSESFLPSAPEISNLFQQFTISESVAAAAVDVINHSSKTVWMVLPCWFVLCEAEMKCAHSALHSVVF